MNISVIYDSGSFGESFRSSIRKGGLDETHPFHKVTFHLLENVSDFDRSRLINSDLIIGPNKSAHLHEVLLWPELKNIPIVSTQATSPFLEKDRDKNDHFHLAVSDEFRVKDLLSKIKKLYKRNRDIYLFTKKDVEFSYSNGLRQEVIRQFENDDDFEKNHILVEHQFEFLKNEKERNVVLAKDFDSLNYRYPIVICSESLPTVHLVKLLRDRGVVNNIFAFGSNPYILKHIMRKSYIVCDFDEGFKKSRSDVEKHHKKDRTTARLNATSIDLAMHLKENHRNGFQVHNFIDYAEQILDRDLQPNFIDVRRISKGSYFLKIFRKVELSEFWGSRVTFYDVQKTRLSLFINNMIYKDKIIVIMIGIVTLIVTLVSILGLFS